ncbi:hypothetical protein Q3G72_003709 [Acer saccharum]|nr:hypothetical protein Q3G72_003709 [Acer saccharum]
MSLEEGTAAGQLSGGEHIERERMQTHQEPVLLLKSKKFRIYVQQVHAGSLDREQRVVFILAEFITPLLANGLMMLFINSTISIKASIFLVAMIIFLVLPLLGDVDLALGGTGVDLLDAVGGWVDVTLEEAVDMAED